MNILFIILAFVISASVARLIIPRILLISLRKKLFDMPSERKVHKRAIPRLGGVSFFPTILLSSCGVFALRILMGYDVPALRAVYLLPECLFLVCGMTLLYLTGIADDLVGVRYRQKFVIQIICASFFPLAGLWINNFYGLFGLYALPAWIGMPFTVLLVVFVTNAINLIDGIDGLASGLSCIALGLLFAINSIQAIGDLSATTVGSMEREPKDKELQGGIVMYGVTNILCSLIGGLPTATYSQNVGIVTTTKVINRCVLGLAAVIMLVAGFVPKFSALLTTIPQCVLGGATISVFASIAMTGIKLIMLQEMNYRNTAIVGLSVALGMGVTQAPASLASFPSWVTTIFGSSPVVLATLTAIILNTILPKEEKKKS